jgi:hypothetical protein
MIYQKERKVLTQIVKRNKQDEIKMGINHDNEKAKIPK